METKLNLHQDSALTLIKSYKDRKIQVRDKQYTHSLIVTPEDVLDWRIRNITDLKYSDFSVILALSHQPELVILGTGEQMVFPHAEQTRVLIERQIGFEVMDTWAACRTYNILVDDGRKVAACLIV